MPSESYAPAMSPRCPMKTSEPSIKEENVTNCSLREKEINFAVENVRSYIVCAECGLIVQLEHS
jgi:hypothetical protein